MGDIAVTVLMSVYNDEKNLPEAVESILNQTFGDFEFIITEDCSKDNSLKLLRDYATKDKRIVLIENKENLKLTKNLNSMLGIAKGDLIARMDSDDISLPERFEKQVKIFKDNPEINLILMDIRMPDMDGVEAIKLIRKENRTVPIIAFTAYALTNNEVNALDYGCNDYISKPSKPQFLIQKINEFIK